MTDMHCGPCESRCADCPIDWSRLPAASGAEPVARQPLTVEEIWQDNEIMSVNARYGLLFGDLIRIVRAVEARIAATPAPRQDQAVASQASKAAFEAWEQSTGVYYHLDHRSGDWTAGEALERCWKAAVAFALKGAA